jgi:Fibronectin type III domain
MKRLLATTLALSLCCMGGLVGRAIAVGAPVVTTGTAKDLTTSSATVTGTVNPNGQSTTFAVQFGTTTGYGLQTSAKSVGSGGTAQDVSAALTGLRPGTTYHFRVIATNASGTTVGGDATFTTSGSPPRNASPPTVTTGAATGVGAHDANVRGTVNPNGSKTTYRFEFGLTPSYGVQSKPKSLAAGGTARSVSATLTGLQSGQTYHYRLVASNSGGIGLGPDRTFTTSRTSGGRSIPAVTSRVTPAVDHRRPFRFRVRGKLIRPPGVSRSRGCRGRVRIRFKGGRKTVRLRGARVRRSCRYGARVRVSLRRAPRTLRVFVRFRGNAVLKARSAPVRKVRAG